jgi:predicted O-linked N-acetylglucosamine transferase (SPINDLY family)
MDYRFTDCIADPPGKTEHLHSEKLVRLDPCFLCFRPWWQRLPVGPPPCEEAGFVTLASFAIREKLSPTVLEAWARILALVPRARLVLKCHAMSDPSVRQQLRDFFSARGIANRRLIFAGSVPSARQHLECYRHVDLVLDPYPYNGTTVTCEALWMGVPTVTWAGETHVSRVGASVLSQVGLQELIAHSAAEYVQKAVEAACSPQRLMEWRRTLRRRMHGSPLMDGERFAGAVEEAYRKMRRA